MKNIKYCLGYMRTIHGMEKHVKRAWAEYFEMERKNVRLRLLVRLYGVLLLGFVFGMILDKIGD